MFIQESCVTCSSKCQSVRQCNEMPTACGHKQGSALWPYLHANIHRYHPHSQPHTLHNAVRTLVNKTDGEFLICSSWKITAVRFDYTQQHIQLLSCQGSILISKCFYAHIKDYDFILSFSVFSHCFKCFKELYLYKCCFQHSTKKFDYP